MLNSTCLHCLAAETQFFFFLTINKNQKDGDSAVLHFTKYYLL